MTRRTMIRGGVTMAASVLTVSSARAQGLHGGVHALGHVLKERVQLTAAMIGIGAPPMHDPALLVAGSADSLSGRFASSIAAPLAAALSLPAPLSITSTIGQDGVTGANQFDSITTPDGNTALVVPGTAWLAWLAGDSRTHFDAARWAPVMTLTGSGAVVVRATVSEPLQGATLRLAASSPTGPDLPAWLALSILGAKIVAVPGLTTDEDRRRALLDGRIDAALLLGDNVAGRLTVLGDAGRALFSFGAPGTRGAVMTRDPALPALPSFVEYAATRTAATPNSPLVEAWRATAAAARLDSVVMLPSLAPAAMIALWRRAARTVAATPLADAPRAPAVSQTIANPTPAPACLRDCDAALASETAALTLRRWLAETAGWRPA